MRAKTYIQESNQTVSTQFSWHMRPMREADIPRLAEIRPSFTSATTLAVERIGTGIEGGWRLAERPLPQPFDKGTAYDFDIGEQANIRRRMQRGDGLHVVVEQNARLIGMLDATPREWQGVVWVWNLMLDRDVRRQGIGRALFRHVEAWGRRLGYRALMFETQTNNVPACKFYAAMGCVLEGIHTMYYQNDDIARDEVAIFWAYPLLDGG